MGYCNNEKLVKRIQRFNLLSIFCSKTNKLTNKQQQQKILYAHQPEY